MGLEIRTWDGFEKETIKRIPYERHLIEFRLTEKIKTLSVPVDQNPLDRKW